MHTTHPTRSPRRVVAIAAALTLFVAGCADGSNGGAAPTDAPSGDSVVGGEVTAQNTTFNPGSIAIAVGEGVTFTNSDAVRHTVTAGSPGAVADDFDEELDGEGGTVTITFDEAGSFDFFCRFHPSSMTGTVTVG